MLGDPRQLDPFGSCWPGLTAHDPHFTLNHTCLQLLAILLISGLTFAILPRCVPGQAEERREENDRSGHSSISEPHLISAAPLLSSARLSVGDPATAVASSSLCLQDIDEGVHADIWGRQAFEKYRLFNGTVNRLERWKRGVWTYPV